MKEDLFATLTDHAASVSQEEGWLPLPKQLQARLPRLLPFSGKDESPDNAVRTALNSCYEAHLEDEALQGRVRDIEDDITQRLETDADSLAPISGRTAATWSASQSNPKSPSVEDSNAPRCTFHVPTESRLT